MAIYRNVQMSFWTDTKITDDFTPEEKLVYLYLITNPHTNLCGCYEISYRQMSNEIGMSIIKTKTLIGKLKNNHKVIDYSEDTKEVLLCNWNKYNWTASEKFRKPLLKEINEVKNDGFRSYLMALYDGVNTVSIPYRYGSDTTVTVTDTVTDTDTVSKKENNYKESQQSQLKMFDRLIVGRAISKEMESKLREWVQYKQERKEPYKETGMKNLIGQAVNQGAEHGGRAVCNAINYSMSSGYKGIVWDRCAREDRTAGFNNNTQREYSKDLELKLLKTN